LPVAAVERGTGQALVFFLDGGRAEAPDPSEQTADPKPDEMRRLHAELKAAQEALIASHHDHAISVQELRAANEELQSVNEEYRSTSEELETSKEELQSINEELQTVNAELKSKLQVITAAHNDLQNLAAATEIGTLFLDTSLRIRMFTPPVASLFNITDGDIGRAITDFTHRLRYAGIEGDVQEVLRDLVPRETEIEALDGRWLVIRMRPYRTIDNKIDGTVVSFIDITSRIRAERELAASERRLLALVKASSEVLYRMGPEWTEMREMSGGGFLADTEHPNRDWLVHYIHPDDQETVRAAVDRAISTKSAFELEHRVRRVDGSLGWTFSHAVPITDERGNIIEWFGAATDITARKRSEEQNATLLAELQHRVRNVLAVVTSMVRRSARSGIGVEDFCGHLIGRLAALARMQTLLTRQAGSRIDLEILIRDELVAQAAEEKQFSLEGPDVLLAPKAAEVLSLTIHELATNAVKYGAFREARGRVRISWSKQHKDGQQWLHLVWSEEGTKVLEAPQQDGFGTELVTRRVPYELGGTSTLEIKADGALCLIDFPLKDAPSILQAVALRPPR
jgi:two-component system CheB/CheR fusion protein